MRVTIERHTDGSFTVNIYHPPLPEGRFKAVCALVAAVVYAGMVAAVTALCGCSVLLLALAGTVLVAMVVKCLE